ncbi:MAG: hypothetical protein ORN24_00900 [Burkholderiales bacterium]|nr:hypothetical protein [Burkholderiales bacterium]
MKIFKHIFIVIVFLFITKLASAYSVTMCDDGVRYDADELYGIDIGISIWNAQWTNNKQFIAPVGNCIYVSGLSGGDFVQFGKLFYLRAKSNNPAAKDRSNNLKIDGDWCMSSNATTIQASGIETTSQWRWLPSGTCYNFGAGQDWHDCVINSKVTNQLTFLVTTELTKVDH